MSFLGEFELTITSDSRVNLPAKYLHELGESKDIFFYSENDSIIRVYPDKFLQTVTDQISNIFVLEYILEEFNRNFYSQLDNIKFDKQGRITIPKEYIQLLQSKSKVNKIMAVGCGHYFELWSRESYVIYKKGNIRNNKLGRNKRLITELLNSKSNEK